MDFKQIVSSRYATKKFDGKAVPKEKMEELYELIRLAPSSWGLQPWKIKVVTDAKTKAALTPVSYNQAQIESCSHLLVFCVDTDTDKLISELKDLMVKGNMPADSVNYMVTGLSGKIKSMTPDQKMGWLYGQVFLALGNALNGAKSLGLDSCPMEGFDPKEYSRILKLPANLVPVALCPVGYAADQARPKLRFSKEKIFI